jgi:hypothetical protein
MAKSEQQVCLPGVSRGAHLNLAPNKENFGQYRPIRPFFYTDRHIGITDNSKNSIIFNPHR